MITPAPPLEDAGRAIGSSPAYTTNSTGTPRWAAGYISNELLIDGKSVGPCDWSNSSGEWDANSDQFSDYDLSIGVHQFTIIVTDAQGVSANLTVNLVLQDSGPSSGPSLDKGDGGGAIVRWNVWNTGYGNYWSDWLSPDVQRDSIVDVPYGSWEATSPTKIPWHICLRFLTYLPTTAAWTTSIFSGGAITPSLAPKGSRYSVTAPAGAG